MQGYLAPGETIVVNGNTYTALTTGFHYAVWEVWTSNAKTARMHYVGLCNTEFFTYQFINANGRNYTLNSRETNYKEKTFYQTFESGQGSISGAIQLDITAEQFYLYDYFYDILFGAKITGISLNVTQVMLSPGATFQFIATVEGSGAFDNSVIYSLMTIDATTNTAIDQTTGLLTIDPNETKPQIQIIAQTHDLSYSAIATILIYYPDSGGDSGGSGGSDSGGTGGGSEGITPEGTLDITENGVYDVTYYESVNVNIPNEEITFHAKSFQLGLVVGMKIKGKGR